MITWDVKITVFAVAKKAVSIIATRTDDTNPDNPEIHNVLYAIIDTAAQKIAVLDNIWAHHEAYIQRQVLIDTFIGGLEIQAKTNLEAREIPNE